MLQTIISAIKNRQVLSLTYKGIHRIVEPHTAGVSKKGHDVLSCYQTQGSHIKPGHEWDLLTVSKISNLSATGDLFSGTRPGYARNDSRMTRIYAEI